MMLAITGAAGFVGRAVVRRLSEQHPGVELLLADREVAGLDGHETLAGDLTDPAVIAALTAPRVDAVELERFGGNGGHACLLDLAYLQVRADPGWR